MARVALGVTIGLFTVTLLSGSVPVHAATVFSTVEANIDGVLSSDPKGPSSANVFSSLDFPDAGSLDFSDIGKGRASLRPDGAGAVYVEALFASGGTQNTVTARATWTESDTNNSAVPVAYDFQYLITPGSLRIGDYAGLEETDPSKPVISYQITIRANLVPVFSSSATLSGGFVSHLLIESGTSLNPSFVGGGSIFGYDFQSRADTIDLGFVGPGETITVEYEMIARVDTPGFEAGGLAQIGDPFDLDGSPGFEGALRANGAVSTEGSSWGQVKSLFK